MSKSTKEILIAILETIEEIAKLKKKSSIDIEYLQIFIKHLRG